jgi:voltage-gated potassium channel
MAWYERLTLWRAIRTILLIATSLVLIAGTLARAIEPETFTSIGLAFWWALTTVTTVGYGDVVPATSGGRFIAVFVMFAGIASVSIVTALVTSAVVTYQQRRLGGEAERHQELVETLARIEKRLDGPDR